MTSYLHSIFRRKRPIIRWKTKLISYRRFQGGHTLIQLMNWVAYFQPDGRATIRKRVWPWSRFGLPRDQMVAFYVEPRKGQADREAVTATIMRYYSARKI